MKYTLLELVQLILASMDSDEVDNITDTVESNQVALLLKALYYDMAVELGLPEHFSLFELVASGDNTKPTLMTLPTEVTSFEWIRYDNKDSGATYENWKEVQFMPLDEFINRQNSLAAGTTSATSTITATAGATDTINWTAHGLSNGTVIQFTTTASDLPAPLAILTDYFIINKNDDDFQVSTTRGGSAIDLTDTGSGTHTAFVVLANIGRMEVLGASSTVHEFNYQSDRHPTFFTTIDDDQVIFNSFDSASGDTTLQASKTSCHGSLWSTFTLSNTFTPDLDPTQFSYYINRAKVRAFAELKQTQHIEAAGEARGQKVVLQKRKRKFPNEPEQRRAPNYGRTSHGSRLGRRGR